MENKDIGEKNIKKNQSRYKKFNQEKAIEVNNEPMLNVDEQQDIVKHLK